MPGPSSRGPRTALSEINMIPLIDVMLVLLIIFMVSAPMLKRGIEIGLPQAASAEAIEEDRITVTVDAAGQFYVEEDPVVDDLLVDEVLSRIGGRREVAVFLEGDENVPFGRVLAAMDALRVGGVSRVALVTVPVGSADKRSGR
jgi:biopolymer transport protein TolR